MIHTLQLQRVVRCLSETFGRLALPDPWAADGRTTCAASRGRPD